MKSGKRRVHSDVEDDPSREATEEPSIRPRSKRARTYESSGVDEAALDGEGENEADIDVNIVDDEAEEGPRPRATRESSSSDSPPPTKSSRRGPKAITSQRRGSTASSSKLKRKTRQVVWTDDEDDEADPLDLTTMDPDDDDFEPEPSSSKGSAAKAKAPKASVKSGRGKTKVEEKDIVIRDERKLPPPDPLAPKDKPSTSSRAPLKRALSSDDHVEGAGATSMAAVTTADPNAKVEDTDPPLPKKRKLPPIKKNKPSTAPTTPGIAKPLAVVPKADGTTIAKDPNGPVGVAARKPAAAMGATDFDLRDASVYASLFNKVRLFVHMSR